VRIQFSNAQFILFNLLFFLAIPFWIAAIQLLHPFANEGFLFGLGSVLGGMACLTIYAWLGGKIQNTNILPSFLINRSIAVVLIGLSVWQSVQFVVKF
jgi:hypothetical protein